MLPLGGGAVELCPTCITLISQKLLQRGTELVSPLCLFWPGVLVSTNRG